MPIYEYHCEQCDSSFETFVRPGHDEDVQCPGCNGVRISRELSVFAARHSDSFGGSSAASGSVPGGGCCGGSCGCR